MKRYIIIMTSLEASSHILTYLMTPDKDGKKHDSIGWEDIQSRILIPASVDKNEFIAAVYTGLQTLADAGLLNVFQLDPNDIKTKTFILKTPLESQNRTVDLPIPLCVNISNIINSFCDSTESKELTSDPNNITSQDIFILTDIINYLASSNEDDEDLDDDSDIETVEDLEDKTEKERKNNKKNKDK